MAVNSRIGGQAVMEGIMMRNEDKYAIAVRKPDQEIEIKVENVKNTETEKVLMKIPFVRGVFSFVGSLVTGISCLMYSSTFYDDEEPKEDLSKLSKEEREKREEKAKKSEKAMMTGTLILAIIFAVGIFMAIPYALTLLVEKFTSIPWVLSLFESVIRIVIFLIYIILISKMKDIQRTFMYHGAEHKCINCVEAGLPLNIENVMKSSRFHKRCGTSFLFFVVIVSAILLMFVTAKSHIMRIVIRILLLPVIAGISYELIRLAGSSDNKVIALLSKPGLAIQRFTTIEPDETMAEVAIAAVEAVFDWRAFLKEKFDLEVPKLTYRSAVSHISKELSDEGVEESLAIAKSLVLYATGTTGKDFVKNAPKVIDDTTRLKLEALKDRVVSGEPVQHITSKAYFYGYEFKVNKDVLIPRFDTENLVHEALSVTNEGEKVLDMCTGSGCIIISMAKEMNITAHAADISEAALKTAKENAKDNDANVLFIKSDMFEKIVDTYDVIVSNPPYIKTDVIETLDTNVKDHDPYNALDGGKDGLDFYRIISGKAKEHLNEGGRLLLEIGYDQAEEVKGLLELNGYKEIKVIQDLSGLDRVVSCIA